MRDAVEWHSEIAQDFDAGYQRSPLFRQRFELWSAMIARRLPDGGRVLDAGCGSGVLSFAAAAQGGEVTAFDASPEMIGICERKLAAHPDPKVKFELARLEDAERFGRAAFDLVLCSSVLEYVPDFWAAVDDLAACLKPGGVLILSMPNGDSLYRSAERIAFRATSRPAYFAHVRHVPRLTDVKRGLQQRGLQPVESHYYGQVPVASAAAGAVGLSRFADTLFAIACNKPS